MSWFKDITKVIIGNEDFSDIKSSTLRDVINGDILTKKFFQKQYGLLILIAFLVFMYVDNRYYCETQLAKEIRLKEEIQDLKFESLTISAELMTISRQSSIEKMVTERGLNIEGSNVPPILIGSD